MKSLIQTSILTYRQMLPLLNGVRGLDLDQAKAVMAAQEQFASLQGEAEEIDGRLNARLAQEGIPAELRPLLRQLHKIMSEVAETNRQVTPRLTAMMAVVKTELREIRTGMNAVTGYSIGSRGTIRGFKAQG